ncbi:MAG: hypothetical protein NVS3B10_22230 [Polyangiales bacterium]
MARTTRTLALASLLCACAGSAAACGASQGDASRSAGVDASAPALGGDADVVAVPGSDAGAASYPGGASLGGLTFDGSGTTVYDSTLRGAALDARGVVVVAERDLAPPSNMKTWVVARVCR